MLTGEICNKIDRIWDAFWSGGISNPLEVIEQMTYLLFIKRLDEIHIDHLTSRGTFEKRMLYEPPFTYLNSLGIEGIINGILRVIERINGMVRSAG